MTTYRSAVQFGLQQVRLWTDVWTSPSSAEVNVVCRAPQRRDRLALVAHFDVHGRIDPYLLYYLEQLAACGFEVALVSTCPELNAADVRAAEPWCRLIATRTNRGIDFGSWKVALELLPNWPTYRRLLVVNDSAFGPFFPLAPLFTRAEELDVPVVGMTDSHEFQPHLQSYFLWFDLERAGCAEFVAEYFRRVRLLGIKQNAIWAYEVPLAARAARAGLAWAALFRAHEQQGFAPQSAFNPTHDAWDSLISGHHFPFLKRELLTRNPRRIGNVETWPSVVRDSGSSYDCGLIQRYLSRLSQAPEKLPRAR